MRMFSVFYAKTCDGSCLDVWGGGGRGLPGATCVLCVWLHVSVSIQAVYPWLHLAVEGRVGVGVAIRVGRGWCGVYGRGQGVRGAGPAAGCKVYLRPVMGCTSVGCVAAGWGDCCFGFVTFVLLLANSSLSVCGRSGSNRTPCWGKPLVRQGHDKVTTWHVHVPRRVKQSQGSHSPWLVGPSSRARENMLFLPYLKKDKLLAGAIPASNLLPFKCYSEGHRQVNKLKRKLRVITEKKTVSNLRFSLFSPGVTTCSLSQVSRYDNYR